MSASHAVVMTTVARPSDGRKIAREVVKKRLAACVQVVPGVVSSYRWKGKIEQSAELLVLCKTSKKALRRLLTVLKAIHPYDVPELIVLPIVGGSPAYLRWVDSETGPTRKRK